MGPKASAGTFADAAAFGELVVLATLGVANESSLKSAGPERFRGKLVIDTTNPLDFSGGMPPTLAVSGTDSAGERVQRLLPDARVVKAFNTVGSPFMFRPDFPGGPPDIFIAGNDEEAKNQVAAILADFGWGVIDAGGIESSRYLEAMCIVWVLSAAEVERRGFDLNAVLPVILSRRSAAKDLKLRRLRSFAVYAAQDDETAVRNAG